MQACFWGELALQPCDRHVRPPCQTAMLDRRVRRWGMSSLHPLPYPSSCLSFTPLVKLSLSLSLSPVYHCMKNSRWRLNFLRCERSLEKISPALQAIPSDHPCFFVVHYYLLGVFNSISVNYYFQVSCYLKIISFLAKITQNTVTELLQGVEKDSGL